MLPIIVILVLFADIASTRCLLSKYSKQVHEVKILPAMFHRWGFYGHIVFLCIKVLVVFILIQFVGIPGMAAFAAVTIYAVVNNLLLWRRLKRG